METALFIGGIAAAIPYAWDSLAITQFSKSNGQVQLPTFSGGQYVGTWEEYLIVFGIAAIVAAFLLRVIL